MKKEKEILNHAPIPEKRRKYDMEETQIKQL